MSELRPRVMALDWGTRRVGVAVSDALGMMAHPVATLAAEDEDALVAELRKIIEDKDITRIVVGLPVNMDGTHGPAARTAQAFADRIGARTALPVETVDERLTSMDADSRLRDQEPRDWKKRKAKVDRVAAALILQAWMEKRPGGW
jgi:putative Holliday junction resolvase